MRWRNVNPSSPITTASITFVTFVTLRSQAVRRSYSSAAPRPTPEDQLDVQIAHLRREEQVSAYRVRLVAEACIQNVEAIMAAAPVVPGPESLLKSAASSGKAQYIGTERLAAFAAVVDPGHGIIQYLRELQEHCKDLEQEKPDFASINPTIKFPTHDKPDFQKLRLEEKARRTDVVNLLKQLHGAADTLSKARYILSKQGMKPALAYLQEYADRGFTHGETGELEQSTEVKVDSKTSPKSTGKRAQNASQSVPESKSSLEPDSQPRSQPRTKSKPQPEPPSPITGAWDDLHSELEKQLAREEAESNRQTASKDDVELRKKKKKKSAGKEAAEEEPKEKSASKTKN